MGPDELYDLVRRTVRLGFAGGLGRGHDDDGGELKRQLRHRCQRTRLEAVPT